MFKYRTCVMIAVAALVVLPALSAKADTIGFWQFEEQDAGTQTTGVAGELIDSSGNGHHAYAAGSTLPSYVTAPAGFDPDTGIGLTRNNDDKLVIPHSNDFNLYCSQLGDWTIEMDIKAYTTQSTYATLFSKRGTTGAGYIFRLYNGKMQLYDQCACWHSTTNVATTDLKDNEWHNIKVVVHADADPDLSTMTYYVDDVHDGSYYFKDFMAYGETWSNQDTANSEDIWIGEATDSSSKRFNGDIGMVKFSYTPVPEPSTLALLACGLIGLLAYAWRKRK